MRDWLYRQLFMLWMVFGVKVLRYNYVSIYVPNEENDLVVGITFSTHEYYINAVQEIET